MNFAISCYFEVIDNTVEFRYFKILGKNMNKLKLFIIICIFLTVLAIGAVYPTGAPEHANPTVRHDYISYNSHVDTLQEELFQKSMDPYVAPCDDFYRHACGNWHSDYESDYKETLTKLDFEIKQEMVKMLQSLEQNNGKQPKFLRDVYNYYKSCIDTETPETIEYMKWLEMHEPDLKWPLNNQNNEYNYLQQFDWLRMLAILRKYGMNDVIFHEVASPTDGNPNILTLELGRPQSDKNTANALRFDVVTGTLRFFMSQEQYHTLWDDVQRLDAKLMELKEQYQQDDNVMFVSLGDMSADPWLQKYLRVLLGNRNLAPNMELVITNLPYLQSVVAMLQRYDPKFVCEYLQVKFLSYLNYKQFNTEYRDCASSTRLLLPLTAQWLYEKRHPELESEITNIGLIFTNLKRSLQRILSWNLYNLDESSLKYLKAKLRTLQLKIGFLTSKVLEQFYMRMELNAQDYYGNRLKIYNFHFEATHRHLNQRLKRDALEFLPLEVYDTAAALEPYLLTRQRAVVVPLSLLQHPFYRSEQPIAYQYSSIGFLMARKIIWEFTISDIDVNAYGQIFLPIMDKLLMNSKFSGDYDHMQNYHPGDTEEIDSAINGLKLAYNAFMEEQGGKDMSKAFFLNFAQMFCGISDANYHRPSQSTQNRKIVNTAVAHVADFSRTFGCDRQQHHNVLYWGHHADVY